MDRTADRNMREKLAFETPCRLVPTLIHASTTTYLCQAGKALDFRWDGLRDFLGLLSPMLTSSPSASCSLHESDPTLIVAFLSLCAYPFGPTSPLAMCPESRFVLSPVIALAVSFVGGVPGLRHGVTRL
jgi:hypothetical protein